MDSLPSKLQKIKTEDCKDEYLNLLFDFLALFVPEEERKYCWVQLSTS